MFKMTDRRRGAIELLRKLAEQSSPDLGVDDIPGHARDQREMANKALTSLGFDDENWRESYRAAADEIGSGW